MSRLELSCREFVDFIEDFTEGDLPVEALRRFQGHLAACPDCVTYLDGYRKTAELQALAFDPEGPLPESVPEDLIAAIIDVRRRSG